MELVIEYDVSGGYECGCYERTLCAQAESAEAWLCGFEAALVARRDAWIADHRSGTEFKFGVHEFDLYDFLAGDGGSGLVRHGETRYELPDVYELLEWFEKRLHEPR